MVYYLQFSHDYKKLPENWPYTCARLFGVFPSKISELKRDLPNFLEYDTAFRGEDGHYPFDFEDALILLFVHEKTGKPFTTIRRNYPSKQKYYSHNIGEVFQLLLMEKKEIGDD